MMVRMLAIIACGLVLSTAAAVKPSRMHPFDAPYSAIR